MIPPIFRIFFLSKKKSDTLLVTMGEGGELYTPKPYISFAFAYRGGSEIFDSIAAQQWSISRRNLSQLGEWSPKPVSRFKSDTRKASRLTAPKCSPPCTCKWFPSIFPSEVLLAAEGLDEDFRKKIPGGSQIFLFLRVSFADVQKWPQN